MTALDTWLFWGLVFIEGLILFRGILLLNAYKPSIENEKDLSIIIPLKGWDETFPELIASLFNQKYTKKMEVIVVADKENTHLQELPKATNLKMHYTLPLKEGWQDKNWRLYQGCQAAKYETLLFLDSDVAIDDNYLKTRLGTHQGDLSFSIPLYMNPKNRSGRFLASCTNFLNFSIYKFGFYLSHLGTAIGPSMLFTCGQKRVCDALKTTKKEIADDHALGFWFKENGYQVNCSQEPIYVKANKNTTWSLTCLQLIRWFFLLKTVKELFHLKTAFTVTFCLFLNAMGVFWLLSGIITLLFYSSSIGLWLIFAALTFIMTETTLLIFLERSYTKRTHFSHSWSHLTYIPLALIGIWLLFVTAMITRSMEWRGKVYRI